MDKGTPSVLGALKHGHDARSEADLVKEQRAHLAAQPGARFLADVLGALHAPPHPLRSAAAFHAAFPPRLMLHALSERADLRVRLARAITGGAATLLRRLPPGELASQIELLVSEDLPPAERSVRAEEDRSLAVVDLYLKYLEPTDLAAYLPAEALWDYEGHDGWWKREATAATRALMTAELKSIRRHGVLGDGEILDLLGDETLERDLPLPVRTRLRAAARKAGREGRPFRDGDLFACLRSDDGSRDLTDHLVESVNLATLRQVVSRAAEVLGLVPAEPAAKPAAAEPAAKPAPPKVVLPRAEARPGRRHTPRAIEVAKPPASGERPDDAAVPSADELLTGFDDDVMESGPIVVEEVARR